MIQPPLTHALLRPWPPRWRCRACASFMPPTQVDAVTPPQWQAPLPHQGTVGALTQWWQQQGDPLLVELIAAAQAVSPSVSQALARVEASRAQHSRGLLPRCCPSWMPQVAASRGVSQPGVPVTTTQPVGLQAAWEMDLVGANRAVSRAADGQLSKAPRPSGTTPACRWRPKWPTCTTACPPATSSWHVARETPPRARRRRA